MAEFRPFNLGQVYGQVEGIKGARQNREIQSQQNALMQSEAQAQQRQRALQYMGKLAQTAAQSRNPAAVWKSAAPDMQIFAPNEYKDLVSNYGQDLSGLDDQEAMGLTQYVARAAPFAPDPKEQFTLIPPDKAAQLGLPPDAAYQMNNQTREIDRIGSAGTTIQMPGQQKAEDAEFGKFLVDDLRKVSEQAAGASDELMRWQMLDAFDVPTGSGEEAKLALRDYGAKIANLMGVEVSEARLRNISDAKSFKSLTQDLLRSRLAAQKGPQTEGDAERMRQTLAQLENPAEANEFIQQANIAMSKRAIEQEQFYLNYRQEKGSLEGVKSAWNRYKMKTPLFGKNPNTNKPVFYTQFIEAFLGANPDATREDALQVWRQKYAR